MQKFPLVNICGTIFIIFVVHFADVQDFQSSCSEEKCSFGPLRRSRPRPPRSCMCDDKCDKYKDCCSDSPYKQQTSNTTSDFVCAKIANVGYFVKRACQKRRYKNSCKFSSNYTLQVKNIRNKVPVTSLSSGLTYGNMACAQCDNVTDFQFWNVSVVCGSVNETVTIANNSTAGGRSFFGSRPDLKDKLAFDGASKSWKMTIGNRTENCTMGLVVPDSLRNRTRTCYPDLVSACPSNWTMQNVTDKCAEYQSIAVGQGLQYRNVYCALCNGVPLENITCRGYSRTRVVYALRTRSTPSLTSIMTTTTKATTTTTKATTTSRIPTTVRPQKKPNKKRSYMYMEINMDCVDALAVVNFTKINAETVMYDTLNRTFVRNTFFINGPSVQICNLSASKSSPLEHGDSVVDSICEFLHFWGVVVAACFASLHLWEFFTPVAASNLNQKNVASYAFAFWLGNVGLLLLLLTSLSPRWYHQFAEILLYFGFMASSFWISSMAAFDISCPIWRVSADRQCSDGRRDEYRTFAIYSVISWTPPTILTLIVSLFVSLDVVEEDLVGGTHAHYYTTLVVYFVLPMVVTMSVNLAFYASSSYVVFTDPTAVANLSKTRVIEFKFHAALAVVNYVMWSVLLLGSYVESQPLYVVFALLDVAVGFLLYANSPVQNVISQRIKKFLDD